MADLSKINWPGWDVVRQLGKGGFGAVYEIERDVFGKKEKAALKVMSVPENNEEIDELYNRGFDEESITSHFRGYLEEIVKEYSIMLDLKGHTNIVYCDELRYIQHDDGIGWDIYIKMELLQPLGKYLNLEYSEEETLRLGIDMCNALILCKQENIIHRDIKPQNILVSKTGDYKLGDFGVAKVSEKTMSGTKIGTYEYMAPEVYKAEHYGNSADIYSLGMVMYWMMNRRSLPYLPLPPRIPTSGEKEVARNRRFSGEKLPAPVDGSKALQDVVLKACAYNPKDRFVSAAEMRDALMCVQAGNIAAMTQKTTYEDHGARDEQTVLEKDCDSIKGQSLLKENTLGQQSVNTVTHNPKPSKKGFLFAIILGILGLSAAILIVGNSFRNKNSSTDTEKEDYLQNEEAEAVETPAPTDIPTDPSETEPSKSAEDIAYMDTEAYCASLDQQGNTVVALQHLQVLVTDDLVDERYQQLLSDYEKKITREYLETAEAYIRENEYGKAIQTLWDIQTVFDCDEFNEALTTYFCKLSQKRLAAGKRFSGYINDDGTAIISNSGKFFISDASEWTELISLSFGDYFFVGLKEDGSVVGAGANVYYEGVSQWDNISVLSAGDGHTVALTEDGVIVGSGQNVYGQLEFDSLYGSSPVVSVCAGYRHTVALHEDGTVSAVGSNEYGQCDVGDWRNIIAIAAGSEHTLGLKSDGSVVATGKNDDRQCNVGNWSNIVALSAGDYFSMGLQNSGTVVAIGKNEDEQCYVDNWSNVVAIAGGNHHALGMRIDGSLELSGDPEAGAF